MTLPAEAQFGVAYQFGNRPLNRRWVNPHDRERALRNEMLVRACNASAPKPRANVPPVRSWQLQDPTG